MTEENDDFSHIIRIAGKDLKGNLPVSRALTGIKGVSFNLASSVSIIAEEKLGIDPTSKVGYLDDKQALALEEIVKNPHKYGIPLWQTNRRNDYLTGDNLHLTGHDLDYAKKNDLDREKRNRSHRGVRHSAGLTVRGQRTKTSGRKGQTVGVHRRKGTKGSGK